MPETTTQLHSIVFPLLSWYRENRRVLPWREDPQPYRVWVSEIMLQQTRVAAVLDYFARFMDALPTVEALAQAQEGQLLKLWQGLGYYNRARNLQKAARQIMEQWNGEFPSRYEDLLTLAGVGEYTAGAIASIAFGEAVPAVDGNVLRVITRLTGDESDISRPETKAAVANALREVIPLDFPGQFNQALMELGALVCLPNGVPQCEKCPLAQQCEACRQGSTDRIPVKAAKKARRVERRVVCLIFHGNKVALRQRPAKGLLASLWEYPNYRKEEGLPWTLQVGEMCPAGTGKHIFTHMEWHMEGIRLELTAEDLPKGWVWADAEELRGRYALPNAFAPFRAQVERRLEGGYGQLSL